MSADTVFVLGGTGAQGKPVVKALASGGKYNVRVLTRNATSKDAIELAAFRGVSVVQGEPYHEPTLREAMRDVSYVFANTNARELGVKHFVYAGLEYASKLGNFNPKYRTGNLDGKGKVVDFISHQPTTPMAWSVLTSCPYIEGLSEFLRPHPDPNDPGTLVFTAPLGTGKCPLIYLEDYGQYSRWILDNPARSNGLELHVGTEDIAWKDLATVFIAVTGISAVYKDVTLDEYFRLGIWPNPDVLLGHPIGGDDSSFMTVRENYSGFWNTWKDNLTKRDYQLLDEILPSRVKSVKEWMIKTGYRGHYASVLKDRRDAAGDRK